MYGIDLLPQLGILQTLQDASRRSLPSLCPARKRASCFSLSAFYSCHVGDTSIRRTGCANFFRKKCTFYGQGWTSGSMPTKK